MKNVLFLLLVVFALSSCEKNPDPVPPLTFADSIMMGAGYADEIFYSLENGVLKSSPRSSWDIAFSTDPMTSTILINEGYGVELYTYPKGDYSAWDAVDTSGMYQWPAMYNSDTSWYYGAFDRNDLGHPDYGWGVYNSQSHDVVGDSLYIIKNSDGDLMKLFIEKREASTNTFYFKVGALTAAGETVAVPCGPYSNKNFVYYSLTGAGIQDIEPESASWDLLFTKYYDESIPYHVTGVLTNMGIETAEVRNTDPGLASPSDGTFDDNISIIGSDWKDFDMGTYKYNMIEDLCYFVKKDEQIYKLTFTGTDGSVSGKIVFDLEKLD